MVLDKIPVPGRPTISMIVVAGGCLDIFILLYLFYLSPFSLSLGNGPM